MSEQARIDDQGALTWDGEPMFCPDTVAEYRQAGLFEASAFKQMRGQTAIEIERQMGEAWDGPGGFWKSRNAR